MGCDFFFFIIWRNSFLFQSTHPHGVRPQLIRLHSRRGGFQSTHPHGVRLRPAPRGPTAYISFQSTHPHGVRQGTIHRPGWYQIISIHAPTWGATGASSLYWYTIYVFQSTHPHGVRPLRRRCGPTTQPNFNPRTHMGCDRFPSSDFRPVPYFNPRTHMGCDGCGCRHGSPAGRFQSTHPHGVRQIYRRQYPHARHFNPRTHMGCDPQL